MACGLIRTMFAGLKKGFLNAKPPPEESFNPDHFPPMIPAYRLVPENEYSAAKTIESDQESADGSDGSHGSGMDDFNDVNWDDLPPPFWDLPLPSPPNPPGEKPPWMPLLAMEGMDHGCWSRKYCRIEQARRKKSGSESRLWVHYKGPVMVNTFTGEERQMPSRSCMLLPEQIAINGLCDPDFDWSAVYGPVMASGSVPSDIVPIIQQAPMPAV